MASGWHRGGSGSVAVGPLGVGVLCIAVLAVLGVPVSAVPTDAPTASAPGASSPASAASPATPAATTAAPAPGASQNMTAFFPSTKGDLTKVTWAHAVNNKSLLAEALNGTVMMLEADVIMGKTPESAEVPVMGHPPETTSDLSLQEFIRSVIAFNTDHTSGHKGIKLDFKSIEVFEKSLDFLKGAFAEIPAFPVWLNADVLPGPVNATAVPVDAARFLQKARSTYPTLMLSLGWTTRWGKAIDGGQDKVPVAEQQYSQQNVVDMLGALKQAGVDQPITYAVRAAFVANSLDELKTLLSNTTQASGAATLTVWSSDDTDIVDVKQLRSNILALGKHRVYLDVGEKLSKKLDIGSSATSTLASAATLAVALFATLLLRGL